MKNHPSVTKLKVSLAKWQNSQKKYEMGNANIKLISDKIKQAANR